VPREQIVDEIPDDRVWFVTELCHDATNERAAAAVPFQVNRTPQVTRTVKFRPAMRPARLLRPYFLELKFSVELRIAHDLAAQRSAPGRDHLDHGLHL